MLCQRCGSQNVLMINSKSSDLNHLELGDVNHEGYMPYLDNIGGGDYVNPTICLNCGQVQGNFPIVIPKELLSESDE